MKIKKSDLDYLLAKVMPAITDNKLFPLTTFIGVKYNAGYLTLCGTDSINYVYSSKELNYKEDEIDFDICVKADLFSKLISKITTTEIELQFEEKSLTIIGNGSYNVAIVVDDEGNYIKFPVKEVKQGASEEATSVLKFRDLKLYNEKSLCKNPENHTLNGYYVSDELGVSTDRIVMTLFNENFVQEPITLKKSFVDLVVNLNNDIVFSKWEEEGKTNIYVTDGETEIYSVNNCDTSKYPVGKLQTTIKKLEFPMEASISLKELSSALDRLSLFSIAKDSYIILNVEDNKLVLQENKSKTFEKIELKGLNEEVNWNARIDGSLLLDQIRSFKNDEVKVYLGNATGIKFVENNVTKIICYMN